MILYADTSALVKLFLEEEGTADMRAAIQAAEAVATAAIAYVELRAALAAAFRERRVAAARQAGLLIDLERTWPTMVRVAIDEPLLRRAGDLAELMRLRGYDAVHLTALELTGTPSDVRFACWDTDLSRAARELGYSLLPE